MSVSLKIKGNKFSNEGVGIDHVAIGDPAFFVLDRQYPPVSRAGYGIVVRHYDDKSVYTLAVTSVSSVDGSRVGRLYIAVAVPRGEQVKGLFNLLMELGDYYRNNYLTAAVGGGYRFVDRKEDPAAFAAILARYPVSHYPYRPVSSLAEPDTVAYVCAPVGEIAQILDDPMRPEFAAYGQVVLLPAGNPSDATLSVPATLHRDYTIVVNGRKVSATVADPDKVLNISVPETKTLNAASVRFTLNEARLGGVKGASVKIDDFAQTVTVDVYQQRKADPGAFPHHGQVAPRHESSGGWIKWLVAALLALVVVGAVCWFLGVFDSTQRVERNDAPGGDATELEELQAKEEFLRENPEDEALIIDEKLDEANGIDVDDASAPNDPSTNPSQQSAGDAGKQGSVGNSGSSANPRGGGNSAGRGSGNAASQAQSGTDSGSSASTSEQDAAFGNMVAKLNMTSPMTKGDYLEAKKLAKSDALTDGQRRQLAKLLEPHELFEQTMAQAKTLEPEKFKAQVKGLRFSNKGLKKLVSDLSAKDSEEVVEYAFRYLGRRTGDRLY